MRDDLFPYFPAVLPSSWPLLKIRVFPAWSADLTTLRPPHLVRATFVYLGCFRPRNRVLTLLAVANVFTVVALADPDPRRLLAARANQHDVGDVQRSLDLDDPACRARPRLMCFLTILTPSITTLSSSIRLRRTLPCWPFVASAMTMTLSPLRIFRILSLPSSP